MKDNDKAAKARDRELELLEQTVVANPRDAMGHSILALLYAKKKVRDKSISHLQSALALAPDDAEVLENVGEAYEDLGDRTLALQYIEKSLQKGYSFSDLKTIQDLQALLSDPRFHSPSK